VEPLRARRAHGDGDINYDAVCCELKPAAEAKDAGAGEPKAEEDDIMADAARLLKVRVQMGLLRGMGILREEEGDRRGTPRRS